MKKGFELKNARPLQVEIADVQTGMLRLVCPGQAGFNLGALLPALKIDGISCAPTTAGVKCKSGLLRNAEYVFGKTAKLVFTFESANGPAIRIRSRLFNTSGRGIVLNHVGLLCCRAEACETRFGTNPEAIRILEQTAYTGHVRALAVKQSASESAASPAEPGGQAASSESSSQLVWMSYDREAKHAFLAGFETSERWLGHITVAVDPSGRITDWSLGFDGGDLHLPTAAQVEFETVLLMAGPDPLDLLDAYGEAVKRRHKPALPANPPVSWCSWYPYRLGVTEDRMLEEARIASEHLKPLGLSVMEIDLGWERDQLPNTFEENAQFPHGLKWLSDQLGKLGFDLGVWKAPFTISEFDPEFKEHPEWLILDSKGEPAPYWNWFWAPHGNVFILDLTHPRAQAWLRGKIRSLRDRGVKYLKADFIGCVTLDAAKNRMDKSIVAGGGTEAARIGACIIREEMGADALLLNCGGPEQPGTGQWPLLYQCNDTGNTGYITGEFQRKNYLALACHLFKNGRWGFIQPSCLCVGLPGTVEEARLRATAAFLAAGQIDISDTLTTLPEDRWEILTACLPVLNTTARAIDLFDPIYGPDYNYVGTCKQEGQQETRLIEHPPGSVWHVHVKADWDEWDLAGFFDFTSDLPEATPKLARFIVPLERLGLQSGAAYWGYEFWSRQFMGNIPWGRLNPNKYTHPGDFQDLVCGNEPGKLDIAFFGPAAKLVCIRKIRPHPWVVGTSFHQSCGCELRGVRWDPDSGTLSGRVVRPDGAGGFIVLSGAGREPVPQSARAGRQSVTLRRGANQSWILPLTLNGDSTRWSVRFTK